MTNILIALAIVLGCALLSGLIGIVAAEVVYNYERKKENKK